MKNILRLEELIQLVLGIVLFAQLDYAWWVFLALILTPDIGMIGYLINTKIGAFTYNLFHHKAGAIILMLAGYFYHLDWATLAGVILFSHAAMDRMLGYGLKYPDHFKYTHLDHIE